MNLNKSILMTLGHNSSVIFYDCENNPIGYEEERLTGIKSNSAYPVNAFNKVVYIDEEQIHGANIFVSHWFDTFDINLFPSKYFNKKHFDYIVEKYNLKITLLGLGGFTHHDAHAYSGLAFLEDNAPNPRIKGHHLVVDGFGNNQEVLSLYEEKEVGKLQLVKRIYGYNNSLGLLYQYATSFCGMKENQDEYKFLGYESMIDGILSKADVRIINGYALQFANTYWARCIIENSQKPHTLGYLDLARLKETKDKIHKELKNILVSNYDVANDSETSRIIIGYFVQRCLEQTIIMILQHYKIDNVTLTGGCFMNVKLNNVILNTVKGNVCVNPLAGDQGAAIGMFRYFTNNTFKFADLCWGIREYFTDKGFISNGELYHNIVHVKTDEDFVRVVSKLINAGNIVNIIQGNMEFGPRALCNTSTLAMPTEENVYYINKVNERNEVMPMAPVILDYNAELLMHKDKLDRVIGSNKFMIMAHDVQNLFIKGNRGICHVKPDLESFTCRPQIASKGSNIAKILEEVGSMCLINTSFNTHGRPIIYSVQDAIDDFKRQREKDNKNILSLVILEK